MLGNPIIQFNIITIPERSQALPTSLALQAEKRVPDPYLWNNQVESGGFEMLWFLARNQDINKVQIYWEYTMETGIFKIFDIFWVSH